MLIADWRDAEELAAWHMREHLGFPDAVPTRTGTDGGLDAVATGAAAQVKHYAGQVGSPDVQQLVGAAHDAAVRIFYAQSGYTATALEYAESADVALFSYDVYGEIGPVTRAAQRLLEIARPEVAREELRLQAEEAQAERRAESVEKLAHLDRAAAAITDALTLAEERNLRTHLPAVFICGELAMQLVAAAAGGGAQGPGIYSHADIDEEIGAAIAEGAGKPASWWLPQLHRWDKRRTSLFEMDDPDPYGWVDRVNEFGTVRRWPLSMAADRGYLGLRPWPQEAYVTLEVAERLVTMDPLGRGQGWHKGALWHINRSLPWARYAGIDDRFHDELIPDVEDWRSQFQLDDPPTSGPGGSALWR
ncbi:restriction endonuclease [Ruania alba]|uniref:restriction endonuclease n=1 Tax=Ruania alba TaxID=648782 RepID=UPI0015879648|nr:restriction endonuclease [Ruania alba]